MRRLRGLSRSGWVVLGLVLGAIVVPAVAVAATITVVQVKGGGNTAFVSPANQLRATEMDPSYNFHYASGDGYGCWTFATVPGGRGAVLKEMVLDVTSFDSSTGLHFATLRAGSNCGGPVVQSFIDFEHVGVTSVPLGPGVTLPPNTPLSLELTGGSGALDVYGYTVSAAAAPATAGLRSRIGPDSARRSAGGSR